MRRLTLVLVSTALLAVACGFPDYAFDHGGVTAPDAATGGGGSSASGGTGGIRADGGAGKGGAGGATGGTGPGGAPDAGIDGGARCASNADCKTSETGARCDLADGRCVECVAGQGDCPPGTRCSAARVCEIGCDTSRDCVGVASVPTDAGVGSARDGGPRDASAAADSGQGPRASRDAAAHDASVSDAARDAHDGSASDAARDASAGLACDAVTHTCTGCVADGDCPAGSICDAATRHCVAGCSASRSCPAGFDCCGGECFELTRSAAHCGSCATSCVRDAGLGACVAGACRSTECQPGFADCNQDPRDGCETDLSRDPASCGACASVCPTPPNAAASCSSGVCGLGVCQPSFANCDGQPDTGCEVNLGLSTPNCGTCGFACNLLNANPRCYQSACEITTCRAGFADCDKLTSTGCEVNTQSDPSNCGKCGNTCGFPSADARCQGGVCKLGACLAGTLDCNTTASDGCEVNPASDPDNCGSCAHVCTLSHATPACSEGLCAISACDLGWGDCDGVASNGCETNLQTSAANCSACGKACSSNHGTPSCALGACAIACTQGYSNCDSDATDGCETETATNVDHCGSCPKVCSTSGGVPNCVGGVCGLSTCAGTLADCNASTSDGCEVDTSKDLQNCGGCGKACFIPNGTAACTGGLCAVAKCNAGYADCNGSPDDGCETRLNTLTQCGACNQACALPHANSSCLGGTCTVASCVTPFVDCNGVASDGCEVDTSQDLKNCGGCGAACDSTNGTPKCLNGSCSITCNTGFANCNAAVSDGCERATKNDVANCGACGAVCAVQNGTPACIGTTCTIASCTAPFADCDHLYATGCEINTSTRIDDCGACGKACDTSRGTPTCSGGVCSTP